jgi:hypothetical protein
MAGSIWGVTPTARAKEKSTASMIGRPSTMLTTRIALVRTTVTRVRRSPKRADPFSKLVRGAAAVRA